MTLIRALLCASAIACALSIPIITQDAAPVPPTPPMPTSNCSLVNTSVACLTDGCCNWCSIAFNSTLGFCMPMIPMGPSPGLKCEKVPADCKTQITQENCDFTDQCEWVPFGPPGTPAGMCVYDWDRCKSPKGPPKKAAQVRLAAKASKKHELQMVDPTPAPTPKPKLTCNMTDSISCDAALCCQWCGIVYNATIGFCLPILDVPVPTLQCSKGMIGCEKIKVNTTCLEMDLCMWLPLGPPGSAKGKCMFDWDKCKAPPANV